MAPARWLPLGAAPGSRSDRSAVPGGRWSHPSFGSGNFSAPKKQTPSTHNKSMIWLVVFRPTPLKNDGLSNSWDDDIPNIWKNQPVIHVLFFLFVMCKHLVAWRRRPSLWLLKDPRFQLLPGSWPLPMEVRKLFVSFLYIRASSLFGLVTSSTFANFADLWTSSILRVLWIYSWIGTSIGITSNWRTTNVGLV